MSWHGSDARLVKTGGFKQDLSRLVGWMNGIHRWAVTEHVRAVQEELELVVGDDEWDALWD